MLKCSFKWHSIWIADFRQLRIRARQARVSPLNILYRHQYRRPPHANRVGDSSGPVDFENHTLIHGVTKACRIFTRTASHKGHEWNEIEQSRTDVHARRNIAWRGRDSILARAISDCSPS